LTLEELQKEIDSLPRQDSKFVIGWLMSQVLDLVNLIEEKGYEETKSKLEMVKSIKT